MDFASVAVVDQRGWIVMQERDEHPAIDPEKWGLPGGGIEPGEGPRAAAHRELAEETGLQMPVEPELFGEFDIHCEVHGQDRCFLYAIALDITDDDVECHEGRQMVFVDPEVILDLDLTRSARQLLPVLLASELYARLTP